jgi:uncharacterized protein YjiS (DUF1127 family)
VQRIIIAFRRGEYPYVGCNIHRPRPSTRKEEVMFAAIVRFIREWRKYNRSQIELSRLGDRELADIGISRSEIQRVAWNAARQH